ncbi:MAG: hypothetical protein RI932_966 [Pseudomonadota bacterium]
MDFYFLKKRTPFACTPSGVAALALLSAAVCACGPRSASKTSLTPDEAFARLKPNSGVPLLCNLVNGYGCGRLSLSSSTGEQSVTHEDFLVTCSQNTSGISVSARDQAGQGPGLSFGFNVAGVSAFTEEKYVCGGLQLTTDPAIAKWKSKSCGVFVRYGETEVWTIADEPCTVTLQFVDGAWRGVVDCPRLSNGTTVWNFNEAGVFTCPK